MMSNLPNKGFLETLPLLLATISKKYIKALTRQLLELARAVRALLHWFGQQFLRVARWLWGLYCDFELQLVRVIVDLILAVVALRYFLILGLIGLAMFAGEQWILLLAYLLVLGLALYRFFRTDEEDTEQLAEAHAKTRNLLTCVLKWGFRAMAALAISLISYGMWGVSNVGGLIAFLRPSSQATTPLPQSTPVEASHPTSKVAAQSPIPHMSQALSWHSYGPVIFGMQLEDAEQIVGKRSEPNRALDARCDFVQFQILPGRFMVENGVITRADVPPGVLNNLNVRVGDSYFAVIEKFRLNARFADHTNEPNGHYLTFDSPDNVNALVMVLSNGVITDIRGGLKPSVHYGEHCP